MERPDVNRTPDRRGCHRVVTDDKEPVRFTILDVWFQNKQPAVRQDWRRRKLSKGSRREWNHPPLSQGRHESRSIDGSRLAGILANGDDSGRNLGSRRNARNRRECEEQEAEGYLTRRESGLRKNGSSLDLVPDFRLHRKSLRQSARYGLTPTAP